MKIIKSQGEVKNFVTKMQRGLARGTLAKIVSFQEEADSIVVKFERFGTSKI